MRILILAAALTLGACANLNAINYTRHMPANRALMVDSDQRGILTGDLSDTRIACAEPSPDTTSVLAAAAAANLSRRELGELQASLALSESAMTIGLRTPTIQLLRDGMYRLCEGYMNGSITPENFALLVNRYQEMMVGLVAIEQLTGVVHAPASAIRAGAATATAQRDMAEALRQEIDALSDRRRVAVARLEELQRSPVPEAETDKAARTTSIEAAQWEVQHLQSSITAREQARNALIAQTQNTGSSARAGESAGETLGAATMAATNTAVADAVEDIARRITNDNFVTMLCHSRFQDTTSAEQAPATRALENAATRQRRGNDGSQSSANVGREVSNGDGGDPMAETCRALVQRALDNYGHGKGKPEPSTRS